MRGPGPEAARCALGPAQGRGQEEGPLGPAPRPRARRPGHGPAQARPDPRDPRCLRLRPRAIFGNQAPDSGNAELLAVGARGRSSEAQWMLPVACDGKFRSTFSMTELHARAPTRPGSPPAPERDGDEWVINGHKWFSLQRLHRRAAHAAHVPSPVIRPSPARIKAFSMILVAAPHARRERSCATSPTMSPPRISPPASRRAGSAARGDPLRARARTQGQHRRRLRGRPRTRVSPSPRSGSARGRIHHAMRWLGQSQRAFDMLLRAGADLATTSGGPLSDSSR
jgi:acyl-CoA dehydrogenase